jgi:peptidoglycan/xylan/chitin deacetylase (PgdA/CDA1 family)/sulfur carrier protein ThiS
MLTGRIRRRREIARRWPALPVAAVLALVPTPRLADPPPPIEIFVDGVLHLVPPRTTVSSALEMLEAEPEAGDLVDVEGLPLKVDAFRGAVAVNGATVPRRHVLQPGDALELIDARDRIEPVSVDVLPVPEGRLPNPQTHVGAVPGEQVITTGAISGKLVSSAFRPSGEGEPPPAVALTFDDGPSPRYTPRILRVLRRHRVSATFFVVGYLARRYPDVVRELLRSGMAVGNHSKGHPTARPFADLPLHEIREQIRQGHRAVASLGAVSVGFRPPGGSWSNAVRDVAAEVGERIVLWSVDAEDFEARKPGVLASRVIAEARPGSIILLHDGGGRRGITVRALPRIINGLRRMGLGFVTLMP